MLMRCCYYIRPGWIILSVLLSLPLSLFSQSFPYKEFTVADGLAHPIVFDITQDRNGFIWIATDNGLSRVNGKHVTTIPIPGQRGAMSFLYFSRTDSMSVLASCSDNQTLFEIDKNSSIRAQPIPQDILSPEILITRFSRLGDRRYLIWDNRYRNLYAVQQDEITKVNTWQDPRHFIVYRILEQNNKAYLATSAGLFEYSDDSLKNILLPGADIFWINFDNAGNLWAISKDRVFMYNRKTGVFRSQEHYINKKITYFTLSSRNEAVIATPDELYLLDSRGVKNITRHLELRHLVVTSLFFDNHDNLWVGTYGHGVRCYYNMDIKVYKSGSDFQAIFPKHFFQDDDRFIICDGQEPFCVSLGSDSLQHIPIPEGIKGPVIHIHRYKDITFIITKRGIYRYAGGKAVHITTLPVRDFLWESNHAYLIKGGMLHSFDPGTGIFREIEFRINDHNVSVNRLCHLNNELYAIATSDALYTVNIDSVSRTIVSYKKITSYPDVTILKYYPRINLLAAGGKNGLCLVSNSSKTILTTDDNLINNVINDIEIFGNTLLIATLGGLNMYDPDTRQLYTINKPLLRQEITSVNTWGKEIIIGTPSGIIRLADPVLYPPDKKCFIHTDSGLIAVDRIRDQGGYINGTGIADLKIETLDLSFENEPGLYYKVLPLDQEYKQSPDGHIPTDRLPPGSFNIELAYANNGICKPISILPLRISAAWYQTRWGTLAVICLVALTAGGISYTIFRFMEQRRRRLHMIQDRIILLEIKALSALLHPHFIFNSLSSIHYLINQKNMEMVNRYLGKFSKLIRTNLETLHKDVNSLEDELEKITLYLELEKLRFSNSFSYRIIVAENVQKEQFMIPVMLLQPFAENALLHGLTHTTNGEIIIRIEATSHPEELIIEIEDNGQGIDHHHNEEQHKRSLGIEIIRNRFTLLSQIYKKPFTIRIENKNHRKEPATGTLVILRVWNLTLQGRFVP